MFKRNPRSQQEIDQAGGHLILMIAFSALTLLLSSFITPVNAAETRQFVTVDIDKCKIGAVESHLPQRIGWPKSTTVMPSTGKIKMLVIAVDFSDAQAQGTAQVMVDTKAELNKVTDFFKDVSGGLADIEFTTVPTFVRLPAPSTSYGKLERQTILINGRWSDSIITKDALNEVASSYKIADFNGAIVIVSGGASLSGYIGLASSAQPGNFTTLSGEIHNTILIGMGGLTSSATMAWRLIAHEIGHLLGLVDLYLHTSDGAAGRTPAPFGQLASLQGNGSDMLAWEKWQLGWIPDRQVTCIDPSQSNNKNLRGLLISNLETKTSSNGVQLVLLKVNERKVVAIEAIPVTKFSTSNPTDGLLIYTVDSAVLQGDGPVTIIPKPTVVTKAPLSLQLPDYLRFADAPLQPGDFANYEDFLFLNVGDVKRPYVLHVYEGVDAPIKYLQLVEARYQTGVKTALASSVLNARETITKAKDVAAKLVAINAKLAAKNPSQSAPAVLRSQAANALETVDLAKIYAADLLLSQQVIVNNTRPLASKNLAPKDVLAAKVVISTANNAANSLLKIAKKAAATISKTFPTLAGLTSVTCTSGTGIQQITAVITARTPGCPLGYLKSATR